MTAPLVFVVGDFLVDYTTRGECTHIAQDAPVTVFEMDAHEMKAGGMWNAAANVRAAGATLRAFGVCGAEDNALAHAVAEATFQPEESHLLHVEGRATQVKHRYLGQHGIQVFRVDTRKDGPIEGSVAFELIGMMRTEAERVGRPAVILIADYGCGVVTPELIASLRDAFPNSLLVCDPYPSTNGSVYEGVDVLTPNAPETDALVQDLGADGIEGILELASTAILKAGEKPVVVLQRAQEPFRVEPPRRDLVDPCGAGDAFVAYLCAELAADRDLREAVEVACHAGACAVSFRGVRVVSRSEVMASMGAHIPG
jgi:D-beta-D-heptose 7-phosphate kinase / D-beta-D-heptose 1-phosphate adenosyltransferase